jgi:hypothetical protein
MSIRIDSAELSIFMAKDNRRPRTGTFLMIPYDWRMPTFARVKERWWNPTDRRFFTPKTWGWGFGLNLYEICRRLRIVARD